MWPAIPGPSNRLIYFCLSQEALHNISLIVDLCVLFYITFLGVPPMVQDAKAVAVNPSDHNAVSRWRDSNKAVSISLIMLISNYNWLHIL